MISREGSVADTEYLTILDSMLGADEKHKEIKVMDHMMDLETTHPADAAGSKRR